jgi:hypothetical protein
LEPPSFAHAGSNPAATIYWKYMKEFKYSIKSVNFGTLPHWLLNPQGLVIAVYRTEQQAKNALGLFS